ncbi:hypothetical protein BC332_33846 [Capsicum chinense]|nr:hypothetical protein BC332_33846 [Capsicum chinense]
MPSSLCRVVMFHERHSEFLDAVDAVDMGSLSTPICPVRCSLQTTVALPLNSSAPSWAGRAQATPTSMRNATLLILPVVICLSQRLSLACRGSLINGYHIQGRQQARKLSNPDTGSRSAYGVHWSSRPFWWRCAPGLNWPGCASGTVNLMKLECSKLLGFGGSMVAKLKLKEIDEKAPPGVDPAA